MSKLTYENRIDLYNKIKNGESPTEEKVSVVSELRLKYNLKILIKVSGLAKSVYYYTLSKTDKRNINNKL